MITSFVLVDEDDEVYSFTQTQPIGLEFTKEKAVNGSSHITIHNLLTADYPNPVLENFYDSVRDKRLIRVSVVVDNSITISYTGTYKVTMYSFRIYEVSNYRPEWHPFGDEYITINDEAAMSNNDEPQPIETSVIITPEGNVIESDTEPVPEND